MGFLCICDFHCMYLSLTEHSHRVLCLHSRIFYIDRTWLNKLAYFSCGKLAFYYGISTIIPHDRQEKCLSSPPHSGLLTSQGPPQMYFRSIWKTFPSYGGNDFRLCPLPSAQLHCPSLTADNSLSQGRTWLKSPRQELNPEDTQSFSEAAHGL